MFSTMAKWIYDEKPSAATEFNNPLQILKDVVKKSHSAIFQVLLKTLFVQNNHRVTIEMTPEEEFKKNEKKKERQLINDVTSTLSEKEMDILVKFSNELKKRQATEDSKEALATIPTISVNDIDSRIVDYSISTTRNAFKSGVTIILHEVPSTGIIYIDFGVDISMVPFSDAMAYLPLYESLMIVSGTKDFSSEALIQEISIPV